MLKTPLKTHLVKAEQTDVIYDNDDKAIAAVYGDRSTKHEIVSTVNKFHKIKSKIE